MSYDLMHIVGPCLIGYAVGLLCGYLLARSWRTRRRGWALRATLDNGKIISWTQIDDGRHLYDQQAGLVGERIVTVEIRVDDGQPWPPASTPEEWNT